MLWLYLLGAVNLLIIVLRRVLRRQKPLADQLYSTRVAIDHVQSGVAWVNADGLIGSVNQSLADSLGTNPKALPGKSWHEMFAPAEKDRLQEAYGRMLLAGIERLEAVGRMRDGGTGWFDLRLVAGHDHKMRFVGHHCLIRDCTHERQLEEKLRRLQEYTQEPAASVC